MSYPSPLEIGLHILNESDLKVVDFDHMLDGLVDEAEVAEGREPENRSRLS